MSIPTKCHVCDSTDLEWFTHKTRRVETDLSTLHEVGVWAVLGCNECSETLYSQEMDTFLTRLSAVTGIEWATVPWSTWTFDWKRGKHVSDSD